MPGVYGAKDTPLFGRTGVGEVPAPRTRFEIPEGGLTLTILEGNRPTELTSRDVRRLKRAINKDAEASVRVTVSDEGDWLVQRDPTSQTALEIIGPEGGVRNRVSSDDLRSAFDKVAENLGLHGQQAALLDMDMPVGPLRVRMVPMAEKSQSPCSSGRWVAAEPNQEQIVPMCWRWQVEVQLRREATAPAEVGVVVMANDGTVLGFPVDRDRWSSSLVSAICSRCSAGTATRACVDSALRYHRAHLGLRGAGRYQRPV